MQERFARPADPVWTADGHVSEEWLPISPVTGEVGAFEWKVPVEQLGDESAPVMTLEELQEAAKPIPAAEEPPVVPADEDPDIIDAEEIIDAKTSDVSVEEVKPKEASAEDVSEEAQEEVAQPKEAKAEEVKSEEASSEEVKEVSEAKAESDADVEKEDLPESANDNPTKQPMQMQARKKLKFRKVACMKTRLNYRLNDGQMIRVHTQTRNHQRRVSSSDSFNVQTLV